LILLASASATPRRINAAARDGAIAIDGALHEAAWAAAPPATGFWQRAPNEGEPPLEDTEFRVLVGEDALYLGVRAFDSQPDHIRGLLTRRDEDSVSDWIILAVDSRHDRRTSFALLSTPPVCSAIS